MGSTSITAVTKTVAVDGIPFAYRVLPCRNVECHPAGMRDEFW